MHGARIFRSGVSKKNGQNKIVTEFFDGVTGESYNALDLIGKYCYTRAVVKIESLFLGSLKISLQVKLYEAEVNLINSGVKRLLSRPQARPQVLNLTNSNISNPMDIEDDGVDGNSIKDDDEDDIKVEETIKEIAPVKKKIVKKVVKKKNDE